jgi:levansucrase
LSVGKVHANKQGVKLTGFDTVTDLLQADGTYYQTGRAERRSSLFRDPFTLRGPGAPR